MPSGQGTVPLRGAGEHPQRPVFPSKTPDPMPEINKRAVFCSLGIRRLNYHISTHFAHQPSMCPPPSIPHRVAWQETDKWAQVQVGNHAGCTTKGRMRSTPTPVQIYAGRRDRSGRRYAEVPPPCPPHVCYNKSILANQRGAPNGYPDFHRTHHAAGR